MAKKKKGKISGKKKPAPQQPGKKEPRLQQFIEKYGAYILLFSIILLVIIVFKDYLFGTKLYLFKDIGSDSINGHYPKHHHIANYIRETGFPKWSFHEGMGQNTYPFSLSNPFLDFLYLSKPSQLAYSIIYAEVLKIILSGFFMFLFFKELKIKSLPAIIGGILFSFSGYMILGGQWKVFSTEAFHLAFLLFAFERLLQKNQWGWFPAGVFLIASFQPFNLLIFSVFMFIYMVYRLLTFEVLSKKQFLAFFIKIASLSFLGLAISAVFFVPNLHQILQSPRGNEASHAEKLAGTGIFSIENKSHYLSVLFRMFSSDLAGTGNDYKLWYNYLEAPLLYMGIVNLVLFPHIFTSLNKKERVIHAGVLIMVVLPIVFPYFRYAFWAFTGDYYRFYSLVVAVVLLLFSVKALNHFELGHKPGLIPIALSGTILLILLLVPWEIQGQNPMDTKVKSHVIKFLLIYLAIIILFRFKNVKGFAKFALFMVILTEAGLFAHITANKRPVVKSREWHQKTGYNDYTLEAMNYLKKADKGFFRIQKDYFSTYALQHAGLNDALVQGFYASETYQSFAQKNYINFLGTMGIIQTEKELETRWTPGVRNNEFLQTLISTRYKLMKNERTQFAKLLYDSLATFDNVTVYKNKLHLPLGFIYRNYIPDKKFKEYTDSYKKTKIAFRAFVAKEKDLADYQELSEYQPDTNNTITLQGYIEAVKKLQSDTLEIIEFSENKITGAINLDKAGMLFFSFPYDKGWAAMVNGKNQELKIVHGGLTGLLLPKGDHEIVLEYFPPFLKTGAWISLAGLLLFTGTIFTKKRFFSN